MASSAPTPRRNSGHRVTPLKFGGAVMGFITVAILCGILASGFFVPVVGAIGATAKAVPATFDEIPEDIEVSQPAEESRMVDAAGGHMAYFFSQRRQILNSDQISDNIRKAIIAIEDKTFMTHHGIDPRRMLGSLLHNVVSDEDDGLQGGSTITQQYIKNMLVEQGQKEGNDELVEEQRQASVERKIREIKYAIALEKKLTKDEILTGYLNIAPFGPNVYGVGAASRAYFSIPASELSISQAALLAGVVQSPVEYDPLRFPEAAEERRNIVLGEMKKDGDITQEEYDEAVAIPVADMLKPEERVNGCRGAGSMAYFCDYVVEEFLSDEAFGETRAERENLLQTGGLVLRTSINPAMQQAAWNAATGRVPVGQEDGLNSAITAINPKNGYIEAMAQNTTFDSTEVSFNTYTGGSTGFPPGSAFKPFILVQWFKEGHSVYESVGRTNRNFNFGEFSCDGTPYPVGPWYVEDLAGKDGPRTAQNATNLSVNQAFVDMATKVDYCKIFTGAADLGVVTADGQPFSPDTPANLIGGAADNVSPLLMASAYGTIANEGIRCTPIGLVEVADRDGKVIKTYEPNCQQVLDATVAKQVATVLKTTGANYQTNSGYAGFYLDREFAAKTGTTDFNSNTWTVGFTPQLATAAWVGFSQEGTKHGEDIWINGEYFEALYGESFVGPMWAQFMRDALADAEYLSIPSVFVGNVPQSTPRTNTNNNNNNQNNNTQTGNQQQQQNNDASTGNN